MAGKKRPTLRADLLLISGLLLAAGLLFLAGALGGSPGRWAVVRQDGREIARYSLDQDGVYPLNGGTNLLVIQGGWAFVREASCPDKLCVRQGRIQKTGQSIVCLPNRLTVSIEGGDRDVELIS